MGTQTLVNAGLVVLALISLGITAFAVALRLEADRRAHTATRLEQAEIAARRARTEQILRREGMR